MLIATPVDVTLPQGTNLTQANIRGMSVSQSPDSLYPPGGGFAANGVDNNPGSFTHTVADVNVDHVWRVDFGEDMLLELENVSMSNRASCCGERLRDITVTVFRDDGSRAFTSGVLNPGNSMGFSGDNQGGLSTDLVTGSTNPPLPMIGRTVVITRTPDASGPNADDRSVLSLGEVVVRGNTLPDPLVPISVVLPPLGQSVPEGGSFTLSTEAAGSLPIGYR